MVGLAHLLYVRCVDGLEATTSATQPFPRTPRQSYNGPQNGSPQQPQPLPHKTPSAAGNKCFGAAGTDRQADEGCRTPGQEQGPQGPASLLKLGLGHFECTHFFLYVLFQHFVFPKSPSHLFRLKRPENCGEMKFLVKMRKGKKSYLLSPSSLSNSVGKGKRDFSVTQSWQALRIPLSLLMSSFLMIFSRVWWVF